MDIHNWIEADVARTPTTPLSAYIADFVVACESGSAMRRPLSETSIRCYRKTLGELDRLMGHPTLAGLTEARVAPVISAKRKKSVSSARLMAAVAKSFSSWLYRKHLAPEDRLDHLGVPVFNGRRRAFSERDYDNIIASLGDLPNRTRRRDRAIVLLAVGSGLRSNELRTLQNDDVHIEQPLAKSWCLIRWDATKTYSERKVFVAPEAAEAIHEYRAADRPDVGGPLFVSEEGKPYTYYGWQRMFGRIADRLEDFGIKGFGAHRLRHQWATNMAQRGATQQELERLGGWSRGSKVPSRYVDDIPLEAMRHLNAPIMKRRVS